MNTAVVRVVYIHIHPDDEQRLQAISEVIHCDILGNTPMVEEWAYEEYQCDPSMFISTEACRETGVYSIMSVASLTASRGHYMGDYYTGEGETECDVVFLDTRKLTLEEVDVFAYAFLSDYEDIHKDLFKNTKNELILGDIK